MSKKPTSKSVQQKSIALHKKLRGKIETKTKMRVTSMQELALLYTPGVGAVCQELARRPKAARDYTFKGNSVAVISDGSSVLGLGNIGPYGAYPVMEGKALIFKEFAGVDAIPLVLDTQDPDELVRIVKAIASTFGGINLEDIAAPACFDIEKRLIEELDIPVMHDDQHGTAIVVLAGLINACKVTKRKLEDSVIVVNGVGAAGIATMRLIKEYAPTAIIIAVDSQGIIWTGRKDLNTEKQALIDERIASSSKGGTLSEALAGADIFIGVSRGNILTADMVRNMNVSPVIFALANPTPEIMPDKALQAGAGVVATGRSDFPNQVNNALVFPGVFRGALDNNVKKITTGMKIKAAKALASLVKSPKAEKIIPDIFDKRVVKAIAKVIR